MLATTLMICRQYDCYEKDTHGIVRMLNSLEEKVSEYGSMTGMLSRDLQAVHCTKSITAHSVIRAAASTTTAASAVCVKSTTE